MVEKRVSIHQPSYFPWLGYLYKVAICDKFVILDDVAANKAAYQFRNIFFCNGKSKFITLPVNYRTGKKINELEFTNRSWRIEHLDKIYNYYLKAKYFNEIFPLIEDVINDQNCIRPIDVISQTMFFLFNIFEINTEIVFSKDIPKNGQKGELVYSICKEVGAKIYLSGRGASEYMNDNILKKFEESGITIEWINFLHPKYQQSYQYEFISGLSGVDILFFEGIKNSKKIFSSLLC